MCSECLAAVAAIGAGMEWVFALIVMFAATQAVAVRRARAGVVHLYNVRCGAVHRRRYDT